MTQETLEMSAVAERLDRLERQNRRLKWAGAAALVLVATALVMGQAAPVPESIEARKFIVRDADGKLRVALSVTEERSALGLYDAQGEVRAALAPMRYDAPVGHPEQEEGMKRVTPARRVLFAVVVGFAAALAACEAPSPSKLVVAADERPDDPTWVRETRALAEQGDAVMQAFLGLMYDEGMGGIPQDDAEATRWYRKSAEQGHDPAQFMLGMMYREGRGVPQDEAEAVKWFRLAAEQGYDKAQPNLGVMYFKLKNNVQAHMWLNLAAAQGDINSAKLRDLVAELMTPAQIAEAQRLAREWKPKRGFEPRTY